MESSGSTRRDFVKATAAGVGALAGMASTRSFGGSLGNDATQQIGVAVAGVGSLATHDILPALKDTRLARAAGLITSSPDRVRSIAAEYGIPPSSVYTYDEMPRMRENPNIHAVYVVTPNALHREHTVAAARAGKHVLCEKPMAVSVAECDEMIAACRAADVKLAVAYRLQFEPHHLECMRLAREKVFGDLKLIEAGFGFRIGDPNQWRLRRELAGGGALMDVGIYVIQACRYLTGEEPVEVVAFEAKTDPTRFAEVDESLTWQLRFPGGCLAACATSYNASGMDRFRAYGPRGWFELDPAYQIGGQRGRRSDGTALRFDPVNHFVLQLDDFAACILQDRSSKVDGMEGRRDMRVIEAIYESVRRGRPVSIG